MTVSAAHEQDLADIRAAQAGERAAFDALAGRYRGLVQAIAFVRTGDREAAEDLTQEVLARVWTRLGELRDPAAFLPWLRAIAVNACRDWRRRRQAAPPLLPLEDANAAATPWTPLDAALLREERRRWQHALQALPAANRLPLVLHVLGRYPYDEIARLLDVPLTTIEGRIYWARQQLRRLLQDDE